MKYFKPVTSVMAGVITAIMVSFAPMAHAVLDLEKDWLPENPEWMPDIAVKNAFLTKYIWRGWNLGNEPVLQNDYLISKYGFTFDVWTNYSLSTDREADSGRYQEYTEIDYTIDYTFNVGEACKTLGTESIDLLDPLNISAGYIYYTFPNVDWDSKEFDTHEVYWGVSYNCLLKPSFKWYWDVDQARGSYLQAGISHTFEFQDGITSTLGMTAAYMYEYWSPARGMGDMVFSWDVSVPVLNHFRVAPSVAWTVLPDRATYEDTQSNEFYGGVTATFAY